MNKRLIFFITFSLSLMACKSKKQSAFKYNQEIVAMDKELEAAITITGDKVGKYADAMQYDSIAVAGKEMEEKVQQKIDIVEGKPAPDVKEGENVKAAVLKYFKFIRSLYTDYVKLGKAKNQAERDVVISDVQKIVADKQKVIGEMQEVQKRFAEANGFKVK